MRNLIHSSISASRLKGDVEPSESLLPPNLPYPLLWFSAENVTLDGSGFITSFINKGSAGISITATPTTSNKATIGLLNNKEIIVLPDSTTGGYVFTKHYNLKTILGIAKYGDGIRNTFVDYDGYFSGGLETTGDSRKASWYSNQPTNPIDNGVIVANKSVVLPLNNRTIGANLASGGSVSHIFQDDAGSTRNWIGTSGDIMFFDVELTAAELMTLHNAYMEYYGLA